MKLGAPWVVSASVIAAALVACGDDDYVPDVPETGGALDASLPPATDAGALDAASDAEAGVDATTPLQQCGSCIGGDCGAALLTCLLDETCRTLVTCVFTNGCFDDLPACLATCAEESELTPGQIFQQLATLQQLALSCGECVTTCEGALPGDAGIDFGGFGGGGFP